IPSAFTPPALGPRRRAAVAVLFLESTATRACPGSTSTGSSSSASAGLSSSSTSTRASSCLAATGSSASPAAWLGTSTAPGSSTSSASTGPRSRSATTGSCSGSSAGSPSALSSSLTTKLIRSSSITIGRISAVLRVMLPSVALSSLTAVHVPVGRSIGVPVKIVVVIDVDVAVVPIAIAPAPTPSTPGCGTERNSRTPHQSRAWIVPWISVGIVRILGGRCTVNDSWIVRRDVHYVRIGLLNLNHLLTAPGCIAPDCLGLHNLLRTGFQISCALGLPAHALNCVHHVRLLPQECVPQIRCPLDVAGHACHHVRKHHQSLNTWVPRLL